MDLKRRDFLKVAGVSATLLTPLDTRGSNLEDSDNFDDTYGVLVDTVICIGCRKCEWACNQSNKLSDRSIEDFEDKSVLDTKRRPDKNAYTVVNSVQHPESPDKTSYMKVQCMHCNEPACVSACIVGALEKTPQGPVIYDASKCMGCRYCMIACPFGVPAYEFDNALTPRVMKCSFCYERIGDADFRPSCVEVCPNGVMIFGKRSDLTVIARSRIKAAPEKYRDQIYGEHEVGGTSWMYLAGIDFKHTDLPELDEQAVPELTETIQHGVFKAFIPPVALYGLLGLIMYTLRAKDEKEEAKHE